MNIYKFKIKTYSALEQVVGKKNIKNLSIQYYTSIARQKGIHFFHIPKSAGTSICDLIYGRRIGHFTAQDILSVKGRNYFDQIDTFTVVRHPVERLQSAYNFARFGGNMGAVKDQSFYMNDNRFRSFDAFVNEWLVKQELANTQIVFRPQFTFVCGQNKELIPQEVFRIETPEKIEKYLSCKLKTEVILNNLNRSSLQNSSDISSDTISMIEDLYSADFELFEYANI